MLTDQLAHICDRFELTIQSCLVLGISALTLKRREFDLTSPPSEPTERPHQNSLPLEVRI